MIKKAFHSSVHTQKTLIFTACAIFIFQVLHAQTVLVSAPATLKDTVIKYTDIYGRWIDRNHATHIQKTWPENGKYRLALYTNDSTLRLVRKTTYANAELQILDGPFENYYDNGRLKDSGNYANKKRQGTFKSWYDDGTLLSVYHYEQGIQVDTGKTFSKTGNLYRLSITDKNGNGQQTEYYPDGNIQVSGSLEAGLKSGRWVLQRENGTKMMEVDFIRDSVAQTTCFGEDGTTLADGTCIYERFAQFPGGMNGWRSYLMKNLKYPKVAMQNEIQGTVMLEFMVDTDGTVKDIKVVSSPHESLTSEALRLMNISPKWEPAIQYNKTVKGRMRQPFNFMLQ